MEKIKFQLEDGTEAEFYVEEQTRIGGVAYLLVSDSQDDEATACWVELVKAHIRGTELLELACGSGEITIALAQEGYHVDASDLSAAMIEEAKKNIKEAAVRNPDCMDEAIHIIEQFESKNVRNQ